MARRSKPPKASAKVGYGKPPKHSQFKKGQSGNPKGRPKKSHNFDKYLEEVLLDTVIVQISGEKREVSALEALAMKLRNDALNGDKAARKTMIDLIIRRELANSTKAEEEERDDKGYLGITEELTRKLERALRQDDYSSPEAAAPSDKPPKKKVS